MASAGTITAKMMRRASGRQNPHRQVGGEENKRKTKRAQVVWKPKMEIGS